MDDNQKSYIHTPKPQIQSVEPRKGRLGIGTIPCVFGEERRIKNLWCVFFSVVFFGVWKKEKTCREAGQKENFRKKCGLSDLGGCLGLFIAPTRTLRRQPFKGCQPQNSSNRVDLDTFGKVLTSYFWKGMELENPMVESKVMALRSLWCINQCVISVFVISRPF